MSYFCAVNDVVEEKEILVWAKVIYHQQKIHLRRQARVTRHLNQPWLRNTEVFAVRLERGVLERRNPGRGSGETCAANECLLWEGKLMLWMADWVNKVFFGTWKYNPISVTEELEGPDIASEC